MIRSAKSMGVTSASLVTALMLWSNIAVAQTPEPAEEVPTGDAITFGEWAIRPRLQLRTRGEIRNRPFDTGGFTTQLQDPTLASITPAYTPQIETQGSVLQRSRIGMSVERGQLRAVVELQDARVWGENYPLTPDPRDRLPSTGLRLGYGELHGRGTHPSYLRLGRQEILWGEGRLLGLSDWSPTGRSLDAVRGVWVVGDFDLEAFASMLIAPGGLSPDVNRGEGPIVDTSAAGGTLGTGNATADQRRRNESSTEGPGAQLYGARISWHLAPLFRVEVHGLGRFVREPNYGYLQPSDIVVAGGRLSGKHLGFQYSAEGAYEFGRVAVPGDVRDVAAYAAAARAAIETGLFWKLTLEAQGSYASGQKGDSSKVTNFDPILPDVRTGHGPMGLYAWSNLMEAAAMVHLSPWRESRVTLGYRHVALAQPEGEWRSASLLVIGQDSSNTAHTLGNEFDFGFSYVPWAPLAISTGYGLFLTGDAGKALLANSGRGQIERQHYGYLQATLTMK